ncbi:MAG: sigma-54-dependent Fis family transcriptional regulator [Candidatus Marinimicrobia bacterium]|nr:sigma-54-dependent Fis family transcriptional regulator [Candidatus Neomarinimicrobiota bacterium]
MHQVLIVDPDSASRRTFCDLGALEGWDIHSLSSGFDTLDWLAINKADIVVMSMALPLISSLKVLEKMKKLISHMPVILLAEPENADKITDAYQKGAFDVLFKPITQAVLISRVKEALIFVDVAASLRRPDLLHPYLQGYGELDGKSRISQELYTKIDSVLDSDITVMITGESGTGKEITARTIHRYGNLKDQPFVSVNCAAIPESLQESELFGYDKGAFTGAYSDKIGKFEAANHGTLFLDEVGDMSMPLQAKILRFIETGELERVGGVMRKGVEVRLIVATNKDLEKEVEEKRFREDLYHRINVYPITMPSLRERKDDIPLLSSLILGTMIGAGKKQIIIPPETYEMLQEMPWKGNIRELINALNRAVVSSKDGVLSPDAFALSSEAVHMKELTEELVPEPVPIAPLRKVEMEAILNALRITDGNIMQASLALGITRATLYNKLKRYNIKIKREIKEPNSQEV